MIVEKIHNQKFINLQMRRILVDWLFEVSIQFKLLTCTFYDSIALIDVVLKKTQDVKKENLQLIGVACLHIACKVNEVFSPCTTDFSSITDNTYDSKQIHSMEIYILDSLDYDVYTYLPDFPLTNLNSEIDDPKLKVWVEYGTILSCMIYDDVLSVVEERDVLWKFALFHHSSDESRYDHEKVHLNTIQDRRFGNLENEHLTQSSSLKCNAMFVHYASKLKKS